jgi:hypothetical protein
MTTISRFRVSHVAGYIVRPGPFVWTLDRNERLRQRPSAVKACAKARGTLRADEPDLMKRASSEANSEPTLVTPA